MNDRPKLVVTADGSHTLKHPIMDEHYHSLHGAIQESGHVYITNGLNTIRKDTVSILEMGFGTGLNALLTLHKSELSGKKINYSTYELYPLEAQIYQALNYEKILAFPDKGYLQTLHKGDWNRWHSITSLFRFIKYREDIRDISFAGAFDLVYYDAFDPAKQPELWSSGLFSKIADAMNKNGILVTYSAKGDVKRAMKSAGLYVEKIDGPPGKREMIRAKKIK